MMDAYEKDNIYSYDVKNYWFCSSLTRTLLFFFKQKNIKSIA